MELAASITTGSLIERIDFFRADANRRLDPEKRVAFGPGRAARDRWSSGGPAGETPLLADPENGGDPMRRHTISISY